MSKKQNILSIDSGSKTLNISLLKDGVSSKDITSIFSKDSFSNNEELAKLLSKLLKENLLEIKDIDTIIINRGPGSFTGLRIGYAFLEGILSSIDVNVSQIVLLEAVRHIYSDIIKECDVVCQHIRKENFFAYLIKDNKLEYVDSDFLISYITKYSSKVYVINDIEEDIEEDGKEDGKKTFNSENLSFIHLNFIQLNFISSKILIEYYTKFNIPNIKNMSELKPNYVQKISAKTISERNAK
ncbi:MAG: hypothetical protein ACOX3T_01085 [Bdellovibrionota bacterium]